MIGKKQKKKKQLLNTGKTWVLAEKHEANTFMIKVHSSQHPSWGLTSEYEQRKWKTAHYNKQVLILSFFSGRGIHQEIHLMQDVWFHVRYSLRNQFHGLFVLPCESISNYGPDSNAKQENISLLERQTNSKQRWTFHWQRHDDSCT